MLQNLPELVLDLVYDHLSYEDVLALRSTCKYLKSFVDEKQFSKLHLFVRKFSCHQRLFYTGDWICHAHSLHSMDLTILNSKRFREQFRYVRKMTICNNICYRTYFDFTNFTDEDVTVFDLTGLNCFAALSHLEMDEIPAIKGKLNLPELQIAAFQTDPRLVEYQDFSFFELECPKLKALKVFKCKPVLACETNRLVYLQHFDDHDFTSYVKSISPNLEKLSTICLESTWSLLILLWDLQSESLILPSLSETQLEIEVDQPPSLEELDDLNELANCLEYLKQDDRTKHIKFILNGKLINSPDELSRIVSLIRAHFPDEEDSESSSSSGWMEDRLNDRFLLFLNGTPELEFLLSAVDLVELYEDIASEEVIKKFKNVKCLKVNDHFKPNVSTFELFARNCKSLTALCLKHQTVTGRLLEILSDYLLNLTVVKLTACQYETLKPLTKFRNLEVVSLDFNPPRDELTFIFENSRTLELVEICGRHSVELMRSTTWPRVHRISTTQESRPNCKFRTLLSMITYYYENHLFVKQENTEMSIRLESESTSE